MTPRFVMDACLCLPRTDRYVIVPAAWREALVQRRLLDVVFSTKEYLPRECELFLGREVIWVETLGL